MKLYNTLSRTIEEFEPISPSHIGMYACGPTVYDYTHIGHLRKYIGDDILVRVLKLNGYDVKHVMNITDVGHLSGDNDAGEDKLEKGAKKLNKSPLEVAQFFETDFWKNMDAANVARPDVAPRATEHIEDQIALIETLEAKGFTYKTSQAIYFDVSKFSNYTKLSNQSLDEKQTGAREDVVTDSQKKNPADFALWFFTTGRFSNHAMHWPSPWGEGFPGWHIECSAMSMKYLGLSFDIHTGGIDHIPVHHTNEIAQSEAATGERFVKYWVHHAFLRVEDEKMSKSLNNFLTLEDLKQKGFSPLVFRYLVLQTHYRSEMNFTWEALEGAQTALEKLYALATEFPTPGVSLPDYEGAFKDAVSQDLNTPKALSVMWELLRQKESPEAKAATLFEMDKVLGLEIREASQKMREIPEEIRKLVEEREGYRKTHQYGKADQMRNTIEKRGFILEDTEKGVKVMRKV